MNKKREEKIFGENVDKSSSLENILFYVFLGHSIEPGKTQRRKVVFGGSIRTTLSELSKRCQNQAPREIDPSL